MAKKSREALREEDKRPITKNTLKKLVGIFRFLAPYKFTFIIGLICLMLSSIMLMAFPFFAGKLLDVASGKEVPYFNSINTIALVLLGILVVQSIFSFTRVYTFAIVSEKSLADVRNTIYKKIIWLPITFFDNRRVGELTSRITSDVAILQDTFTTTFAELIRQVLTLTIGIGVIFYFAPKLTVFMLLTFPAIILLALFFGKAIRNFSRQVQDKLAEANVIVEESLQAITVVKAFTNEWFEIERYKKALNSVVDVALRSARYRGLFISFVIFALFGGIVAVVWYGATLVQSGEITIGDLLSFVLYTTFIGGSIAGLGDIYAQIQRSIGASERILEIIDQTDEQEPVASTLKLHGDIDFRNVNFAYPSRPDYQVLRGLDFSIKAGEKVALVGQSGSGKSTIINLLMRFYPLQQGSINVDGLAHVSYNLTSYRSNVGIVPQEVILFGGTIQENIAYGKPGASEAQIIQAARKANAYEFIERFPDGLNTMVGERGVKLSGGQRQRIAIARAILRDPSILILDEATSSLDAESEVLVQEALEKLMEGRTTLIIAHRLSTIRKVDRIFVIRDGQLAETGSHTELSQQQNGIYSNLLKLQLQ
ncbi:multidrug ABC transporter ATP-binding protein [Chryseotalea sanaruensis]|uniref:Multidrug ABC transporter ATP-binding protein n=1 Tax=Chryseotalea sanaruensis TaxID=2482724 RepID=A0A401U8J5_9BACT|nr:ABC transporter transmembrane domain-containing protein [Chryseotalea sanaruensis]GCC51196.1 multidrug ABC transporter ATP-binding protein [Chryseotalea sanaruensis]